MKRTTFILIFSIFVISVFGQYNRDTFFCQRLELKPINYKELIIPTVLVGYGILAFSNESVKSFDNTIKNQFNPNRSKIRLDDYLQFTPTLTVYGLNLVGVEGKHNFFDRTMLIGMASAIMVTTVYSTKHFTHILRPDNSTHNSLPSGHTAMAFMGAEFLYQEYKEKSIWYGVAGYSVAGLTGFLRIYNNRHWFSDVLTGAGIGILSTKMSYYLYPYLKKKLFYNNNNVAGVVLPYYNGRDYGLAMSVRF